MAIRLLFELRCRRQGDGGLHRRLPGEYPEQAGLPQRQARLPAQPGPGQRATGARTVGRYLPGRGASSHAGGEYRATLLIVNRFPPMRDHYQPHP